MYAVVVHRGRLCGRLLCSDAVNLHILRAVVKAMRRIQAAEVYPDSVFAVPRVGRCNDYWRGAVGHVLDGFP